MWMSRFCFYGGAFPQSPVVRQGWSGDFLPKLCVCETSMVACLCVSFDCDSLSEELGREGECRQRNMDFEGAGGSGSARPRERFGLSRLQSRSLVWTRGEAHVK